MKQQLLNYGTQIKKWKSRIKIFLFILFLSSTVNSSAQLISTYTFTTATGTTADAMASPTVGLIFSNNDDSVSALTTFSALTSGAGFTFLFDGTAYTTFSVSSNGLLQLGTRIPSVDSTNLLASASFNPKITAYWDNLHTGTIAGGGKVHCKFIGSSPSRKLVIEWFETVPRNAAAAANAKFQVWLFESTHATTPNLIQLVYGSGLVVNGTNGGYSIGLANSATDFWSVTSSSNTASSVTANFANTTAITSGRSYTFTPPAKPACAAGLVPANLAIVPTNSSVSWGGVTGATGYDVYFGTASTPPLMVTNQSGVSYTPVGMTDNTQYFWRIAPRNAGGPITTCSTISFTALNVPPCATNFAPANGTTGVYALTPTILSWAIGGGVVTGYDVYLDTLASPVKLVSGNQAGTTYDPVTLLANRTYYWKIIPRNSSGPATGCTVTSFTTLATPTTCGSSFTPVNGTTGVPALTPTKLSWVRASGIVTDYDVYLDTTTPPVNIVSNNQPDTTFNPSALLPNKLYYWRVIPRNGSGPSSGSCSITSFTTLPLGSCVTGQSPANAASSQPITTNLSWTATGATVTGYNIYLGTTNPPPLVAFNPTGTVTYNPGTLSPGTLYYWRIAPVNGSGENTCSTYSFTTLALPPCASGLSPSNGASNVAISSSLTWNSGGTPTATGYDVYFGTNPTPPLISGNQAGLTYNPGTLVPNTTYYWQIVPTNSSGQTTGCLIYSFTTLALPSCATSFSPASGSTAQSTSTTLSWFSGGGIVSGYDVYFGTASTPPLVVTQTITTYNPGALSPGVTYYWKIVPKNSSGSATGCTTNSFTTLALPVCAINLSPTSGSEGLPITTTLSWSSGGAPTPAGYDVYFGTASSPPLVSSNQAGSTYNPGTLLNGTTYYYKIVPRNSSGPATGCTVNSFITIFAGVPVCATNLSPLNLTSGLPTNTTLSWTSGGTPSPTSYDIYLSTTQALVTSSNASVLVANVAGTSYSPVLAAGTTYYWRIIARNAAGVAAGCSVLQFTTFGLVNYNVTRNTNISYSSITTVGNKVGNWRSSVNTDDNLSDTGTTIVPIGFTFFYQGISRSNVMISTNGFITLNTATTSNGDASGAPYGPSNSSFSASGASGSILSIAPFYDDLVCQGNSFVQQKLDSSIKYITTGTAPNRIFTVEWISMEQYNNPGPDLNFQVKLYEGSNNIEFIYGTMQGFDGTKNSTYSYSCGLNASVISLPPTAGQLLTQDTANTRYFSYAVLNNLNLIPECNSSILFTPGSYSPYVPGTGVVINDEPAGAILLPSNAAPCTNLCGTYYSSAKATASSNPSCSGTPNTDVWFKFIANSPSTTIKVRGAAGFDAAFELFDNAQNSIACQNTLIGPTSGPGMTEVLNTTTLTTGSNYYIRVYNYSGGSGTNGAFSICINSTPQKPVNDSCAGSIHLNPSTTLIPIIGTNTTVANAELSAPSPCNSTIADDDVWYYFNAPAPIATITVISGTGFNAAIQTFSGGCNSLTTLQCADATSTGGTETINLNNLVQNAPIYVRVYHAGSGAGSGNFTIGVTSLPPRCPTQFYPPDGTTNVPLGGIRLKWNKAVNAVTYDVYLDTITPPKIKIASNISDTSVFSGPVVIPQQQTYYWLVVSRNTVDTSSGCFSNQFSPSLADAGFYIKAFIQGYYVHNGSMKAVLNPVSHPNITDSILISFRDTVFPYDSLYGFRTAIDTLGYSHLIIPSQSIGSYYYIVLTHRNSIKTWSIPIFFEASQQIFDFTSPPNIVVIPPGYGNRSAHHVQSTGSLSRLSSINLTRITEMSYRELLQYSSDFLNGGTDLNIIDDGVPGNLPATPVSLIDMLLFVCLSTP